MIVEPIIIGVDNTPDDDLHIGEPFYIECTFIGQPPPRVVWSQDGIQLNKTVNGINIISTDSSSRLDVDATSMKFSGEYECSISNVVGNASQSFQINLQEGQ